MIDQLEALCAQPNTKNVKTCTARLIILCKRRIETPNMTRTDKARIATVDSCPCTVALSVLVMFGVSIRLLHRMISLAVYVFTFLVFWLIRSRSYVGSVYRMRSLAVSRFSKELALNSKLRFYMTSWGIPIFSKTSWKFPFHLISSWNFLNFLWMVCFAEIR